MTPDDCGLHIHDDSILYTRRQVSSVLKMLGDGNDSVRKICSCDALLGVVRFVEGYYIVAVVQSVEVATIGPHSLRRVDETRLVPIANPVLVKWARRSDEAYFMASFQAIALQGDLFFSYTYDLTRPLQHNILVQALKGSSGGAKSGACDACRAVAVRAMGSAGASHLRNDGMFTWNAHHLSLAALGLGVDPVTGHGLNDVTALPSPWFVPAIQGFVGQVKLTVLGRPIFVTLIARRSRNFAGARFLRRGVDANGGWVANEVESEQIVHDGAQAQFPDLARAASQLSRKPSRAGTLGRSPMSTIPPSHAAMAMPVDGAASSPRAADSAAASPSVSSSCVFCHGQGILDDGTVRTPYPPGPLPRIPVYTSFVQHRGSIPLLWSQDNSAMTPKPPITLNIRDPFFVPAGKHFNRMVRHYGSKIIVFNLIKTREKVKREAILGDEFEECVAYLNQFLGEGEEVQYHHVDMSREAKAGRVIDILEQRVEDMVDQIGFFSSGPEPVLQARMRADGEFVLARVQNGVIRTNCIDCLDRTNAAAFVIGKSALGRQLVQLGVLKTAAIPFDTEAIDLLTELYQEHGDAIALQYGGSALVNTMKTYRDRTFISQSRDMLESAKRYWNNSFSDAEKQDAIDIFLGVFQRWDDYRLPLPAPEERFKFNPCHYTEWRQDNVAEPFLERQSQAGDEEPGEPVGLVSLGDIYGADRIVSQSTSPFKTHPPPDNTMFDLSGLKKWLSARNPDSLFSRDRASSVSSFFIGYTPETEVPPSATPSCRDPSSAGLYGHGTVPLGAAPLSRISESGFHGNNSGSGAGTGAVDTVVFRAENNMSPMPIRRGSEDKLSRSGGGGGGGSGGPSASAGNGAGLDAFAAEYATKGGSSAGRKTGGSGGAHHSNGGSGNGKKPKKKAIELLVEKLLSPEIAAAELREYKRYVYQFSTQGLQLERSLPLLDSSGAHATHPDYPLFLQHVRLAAGDVAPAVDPDDESLYEAYVHLPGKIASGEADESDALRQRIAAYETWIAMGRYKTGSKKR
ncbi:phosphatidylinositol-3,5-bisphosphate 5-phosphatase [Blastocladiella emersonii ATCC 22665]|nr:phosphatidylinositol-3,5-bisphosphate 5-phosphatase [Blastocladiella emersonii ATCC 22665]